MRADKSLGQHWLTDEKALETICKVGEVGSGDNILEIGPGTGSLTDMMLDKGAQVTAVELDKRLIRDLKSRFSGPYFRIFQADILTFDLSSLEPHYKIVANIPYYLTSKLLRTILQADHKPTVMTLLIQKEVAQRIAAQPGKMSILSVSVQFYAEAELFDEIPASSFQPPPEVDSQIVRINPRSKPLYDVDESKFFRMVKAGFSEKRKKLINSLSGGLAISKEQAREVVLGADLNENVRAQELSMGDWDKLYNKLYN